MALDKELSEGQSRQIAATIREELARRRISRQQLAEKAKLSISTLEKVLGGSRPFTLGNHHPARRSARRSAAQEAKRARKTTAIARTGVAPDGLGAYSHRAVAWIEGVYITVRPSFGEQECDLCLSHGNHLG